MNRNESRRALRLLLRVAGCSGSLVACDPTVTNGPGGGAMNVARTLTVDFLPAGNAEAAPDIGWALIHSTAAPPDPSAVELYRGKRTSTALGEIARGKTSDTLDSLRVPANAFSFLRDTAVAPEVALDAGDYTLALAGDPWSAVFHVIPTASPPVLRRAWPPRDVPASASALVYCADGALPVALTHSVLLPADVPGAFAAPLPSSSQCLSFMADATAVDGLVVPPPTLAVGNATFRLAPGALALSVGIAADKVACDDGEVALGPACAKVFDDRLDVRTPTAPIGWAFDGLTGGDTFESSRDGHQMVVHGLVPAQPFQLSVLSIDSTGTRTTSTIAGMALPAMPHLVITEVYAHPLGARPQEEWVELYNDGTTDVSTKGVALLVSNVPISPRSDDRERPLCARRDDDLRGRRRARCRASDELSDRARREARQVGTHVEWVDARARRSERHAVELVPRDGGAQGGRQHDADRSRSSRRRPRLLRRE